MHNNAGAMGACQVCPEARTARRLRRRENHAAAAPNRPETVCRASISSFGSLLRLGAPVRRDIRPRGASSCLT
jgi:hypothetical protein